MTTAPRPSVERNVAFDMLRTLACLMVVLLHTSSQMWYVTAPSDPNWVAMHIWNTATRSAVPIFFMISGALFLNAPPPGKKLWTRNIPRLLSVYVIWSLFYGVDNMNIPGFLANPLGVIDHAVEGRYHLWFLPSMIGVYLLLPALYAIVHYDGGRALRPYLWVFGIFGILCGTIAAFEGMLPWAVSQGFAKITPELCKCCGYFILGYVLSRIDPARLRRWPLIAIFCAAVGVTSLAGILFSQHAGTPTPLLHGNFTAPTCTEAVCLFLLFRTVKQPKSTRTARIFGRLSACTLGIYLLHPFALDMLRKFGFYVGICPAWVSVPIVAAAVTLICLAVTAALRRIPVAGKWIV